jgi:hypothetical protein
MLFLHPAVICPVLQEISAKVAAQGEESKKVLELNAALAQENALLRARTDELNALLEESHSKVEKLSGLQRQQLEGLQKKLEEQVRAACHYVEQRCSVAHVFRTAVSMWVCTVQWVCSRDAAALHCCYVLWLSILHRWFQRNRHTDDCCVPYVPGCWARLYWASQLPPWLTLCGCVQDEWVVKSQQLNKHMGTLIEENRLLQTKADAAEQQAQSLERLNQVYKETMEATIQKAEAGQKKVRTIHAQQRQQAARSMCPCHGELRLTQAMPLACAVLAGKLHKCQFFWPPVFAC